MIDRSTLELLAHAGVQAPSGDNSQPWSFELRDDSIVIHVHPDRDHPILNIEGRGTWLATGAAIENIVVAAHQYGLSADVLFDRATPISTTIQLRKRDERGHRLFDAILRRHTHRGPYIGTISNEVRAALESIAEPHCSTRVITDPSALKELAKAASMLEETALSSQKLHSLFFESVLWSKEKNESGAPGLYIHTTELPSPIKLAFKIIRHWSIMRILRMLGFPRMAAASNAAVYVKSSACVAIALDRTETEDFIQAGRCMQRAWLEATERGLVAQPLAGLLYLAEYLARVDDPAFSARTKARIAEAHRAIQRIAGESGKSVCMLLRIGTPARPATARAKRRAPHFI